MTSGTSDAAGTFQLTRPARVATNLARLINRFNRVSTHATRTGRDSITLAARRDVVCFNSRDPHGSRRKNWVWLPMQSQFQLTRPARVATCCAPRRWIESLGFNSRDPHGSRPSRKGKWMVIRWFQLTRPARVATVLRCRYSSLRAFQLTRPARVATTKECRCAQHQLVSTHATRTGRDNSAICTAIPFAGFNSRDPHGSRPKSKKSKIAYTAFQLTRPARVATTAWL